MSDHRPPPRFSNVSFATYTPQDPSQARASERLEEFLAARGWGGADAAGRPASQRQPMRGERRPAWPWRRHQRQLGSGLYLDGGFGVGKTHLLASAFSAAETTDKRYLGFQDLVYLIGVLGRERAERELAGCDLLCIDEFELDDPGNTLIVKSFLAAHFAAGGTVLTTSNTSPDAQGRGRFNAEDFKREIQSVAERFETLSIGGPDFRHRGAVADWLPAGDLEALLAEPASGRVLLLSFRRLTELLASVHPSRYAGLLAQVDAVYVTDVATIAGQNEALRFVHFVDKLYDLGLALAATGTCTLPELFSADYRHSAYHKKHERCISRLSELLVESSTRLNSGDAQARGTDAGRERRVSTD